MTSTGLLRNSGKGAGGAGVALRHGRGVRFPAPRRLSSGLILLAAAVLAAAAGAATALGPLEAVGGAVCLILVAAVWRWPALAAYLVVVVTPLTVGISSGGSVPLRPNEVVDVLVGAALGAAGIARMRTGRIPPLRLGGVEWSMLAMAVFSSALPLLLMTIRQQHITKDDLLYALVMWKLLGLYVIVRLSVRTDQQVKRCLWLSVAAAFVVALVAIGQSLNLGGISGLVSTYFAQADSGPVTAGTRASSTLGLPAATGDLMIYNLAIVSGLWMRYRRHRFILAAAAALFVAGAVATGEFSAYIGLVAGLVLIAIVTRSPRLLALFIPASLAGAGVLRPVLAKRLSGFQTPYHLPVSWIGRLSNLRTYFWPKLFSNWNYVLGIRPAARFPDLTVNPPYVWIESGYTWLLWGGGIPLLAGYVFFAVTAAKRGWEAARCSPGAASVAGAATFVAVLVTTVLMLFDPHLTYRGSADTLFILIALAAMRPRSPRPASPPAARPGPITGTSRTASRGGSIVTPEDEFASTATGAPAEWRPPYRPDGNGNGSRAAAGTRAGRDDRVPGVNPAARGDPGGPDKFARFLQAHLVSIVVIALVAAAGAAEFARSQTRQYRSQATVVAYPSNTLAGAEAQTSVMATEQAVAESAAVLGAAAQRVHVPVATLRAGTSVSAPTSSYLLNISFTSPSREAARRNAQAVANAYVAYRTPPKKKAPTTAADAAAAAANAEAAAATGAAGATVDAAIVSPASAPTAPSSPNVALDTSVGLIVGILLGFGFGLVRDQADDRLRGTADLESQSGARLLGVIRGRGVRGTADGPAVLTSPGSAVADAFRDLRTRVAQAAAWHDARTILVANPERDDALISANLAAALALAGRRVVMVCGDPRGSRTQDLFGVAGSTGLTNIVDGQVSLDDAVQATKVPGLEIVPAGRGDGPPVTRTSELRSTIRRLRDRADFVLIDAPGVLTGPESSVLAELADMVLVAAYAGSNRTTVRAVAREMQQVHGPLDGCVLHTARRRGLTATLRAVPRLGTASARLAVSGARAVAHGARAVAHGAQALGRSAQAVGRSAQAVGRSAQAVGRGSRALGRGSRALGRGSRAVGRGARSAALGAGTAARGAGTAAGGGIRTAARGAGLAGGGARSAAGHIGAASGRVAARFPRSARRPETMPLQNHGDPTRADDGQSA